MFAVASYAALPLRFQPAVCVPVKAERLVPQSPDEQVVPVHEPAWQVALNVQAVPEVHAMPSFAVGFEHTPVLGSHVPAAWHGSDAVQTTGLDPVHVPL